VEVCPDKAVSIVDEKATTDGQRCNFCFKCVDACVFDAREAIGSAMTVEEVVAEVEKDRMFYETSGGGVTISGGEPLDQPEFLCALLERCKNMGISTAVDTSCYANREVVDRIAEFADLFLCDIKHMDNQAHQLITGTPNASILDNIKYLAEKGNNIIIRVPCIPGLNDSQANFAATVIL